MKVRVQGSKDSGIQARSRFHQVWCDLPFEEGVSEGGMRPEELLLSAIGSASVYQAREYLRGRRALPRVLSMTVRTACAGDGAIEVEIEAPGLSPFLRAGVAKAVETSMLALLLKQPPRVTVKAP